MVQATTSRCRSKCSTLHTTAFARLQSPVNLNARCCCYGGGVLYVVVVVSLCGMSHGVAISITITPTYSYCDTRTALSACLSLCSFVCIDVRMHLPHSIVHATNMINIKILHFKFYVVICILHAYKCACCNTGIRQV